MPALLIYRFDEFTVDPVRRQICRGDMPVAVPQKVFQLLLFLLENPGRILTKRELMDAVWAQAFVEEANLTQSIFLLRKALGEQPGQSRYIITVPGQGYQFAIHPAKTAPSEAAPSFPIANLEANNGSHAALDRAILVSTATHDQAALEPASESASPPSAQPITAILEPANPAAKSWPQHPRKPWLWATAAALVLLVATTIAVRHFAWKAVPRVEGTVVVAEFSNSTGEPAFDAALREGLAAQLEQSPELGVVSDSRIAQTLKLMAQPKDARLSGSLARAMCQRTASAAVIEGSIAKLGTTYVLGLRALNCQTGDILAQDQETAASKEQVLSGLGVAADKLRRRLGESMPSVTSHGLPPENVTTGSLEALEAYGLGRRAFDRGDAQAAIAQYKRAIAYDPLFAMAYARMGVADSTQNGVDATRKAYLLRDRVSEQERFYLQSHYEQYVTGNQGAARRTLETWAETYPHDGDPVLNLMKLYLTTGEYERALPLVRSSIERTGEMSAQNAGRLATTLLYLNRVDEAKVLLQDAVQRHADAPTLHFYLYEVYFLQNDSASMAREASFLRMQPGWNDNMLQLESVSASYLGKFSLAHSLNDEAAKDALGEKDKEGAAGVMAEAALQDALAGNQAIAKKKVNAALALANGPDVIILAGMAQALAEDRAGAAATLDLIDRRYPENTLDQVTAAIIRACALLGPGHTPEDARKALETLAPAAPYAMSGNLSLVPVYVLGRAYLAAGMSENAAAAFQNVLDHYGATRNYLTGPMARLGLARAEEQAGETLKARADYAKFLQLWRDADPNLAALQSARASLQRLNAAQK